MYKHFHGDFDKVASQLNNIYQYNKMTASACAYRWKYYLDPSICKDAFTQSEELLMFQMLKKSDLTNDNFWFELGHQFKNRPPAVLKEKTTTLL